MTISLQTPRWFNPKLSDAQKVELASQVEAVGAKKLALRMCPIDTKRLTWAGALIVGGLLLVVFFGGMSKHLLTIGTLLSLCGFVLLPVAIYGSMTNYTNCMNWLKVIGKYYGKDRAKYGN